MLGREQVSRIVRGAEEVLLSVVVLGELLYGFRHNSRSERNARGMRAFLDNPYVSLVPVGETTADRYSRIAASLRAKGRPIPTNDRLWIAAHAMETRPRKQAGGRSGVGRPPLRACGRDRVGSAEGPAKLSVAVTGRWLYPPLSLLYQPSRQVRVDDARGCGGACSRFSFCSASQQRLIGDALFARSPSHALGKMSRSVTRRLTRRVLLKVLRAA